MIFHICIEFKSLPCLPMVWCLRIIVVYDIVALFSFRASDLVLLKSLGLGLKLFFILIASMDFYNTHSHTVRNSQACNHSVCGTVFKES